MQSPDNLVLHTRTGYFGEAASGRAKPKEEECGGAEPILDDVANQTERTQTLS